ncbi:hypothetical protein [Micromonospora sagamiensis]|uniref:hypothetical protein n=1 Tax=Micromonospora sagamiensis TaxID=47875 RepID=UPI0035EA80E0
MAAGRSEFLFHRTDSRQQHTERLVEQSIQSPLLTVRYWRPLGTPGDSGGEVSIVWIGRLAEVVGAPVEDNWQLGGIGPRTDVVRGVERLVDAHRLGYEPGQDMDSHMRDVVITVIAVRDFSDPLPVQVLSSPLGHALRIRKQTPKLRRVTQTEMGGQAAGRPLVQSLTVDPQVRKLLLEDAENRVVEVVRFRSREIDSEHLARPPHEVLLVEVAHG